MAFFPPCAVSPRFPAGMDARQERLAQGYPQLVWIKVKSLYGRRLAPVSWAKAEEHLLTREAPRSPPARLAR